ncbi:MAG: small multi-drug export protein [bacterium]|nr:small multi-drug export protein [bacterium]MCX7917780.1 small multi-drug export protein [bacterium]MDW8164248.1 small multi-drug export protein [Candidatus Omnitrophota bacterium]
MKEIFITFGISMLPISELRGAIPYGLNMGIPFITVFLISILGNLLPVIPLYFFLEKILKFLDKFRLGKRFNNWLINRTKSKSEIIEIYKTIGLLIFVGIPLPMTGAWTGTIASVIFKLKFKHFLIGIIGGVLMAGIIVSILYKFAIEIKSFF